MQTLVKDTTQTPLFNLRLRDDQVIAFDQPAVMGVINMSPNSFFNPMDSVEHALKQVEQMQQVGVDIIDIGGEATNPFVNIERSKPSVEQEIDRVVPLIEKINKNFDMLISVDTSQPSVMRAAVAAGADLINDQRALQVNGALSAVAELNVPVCLMHFFTQPRKADSSTLQEFLNTVKKDLQYNITRCLQAGINQEKIIIDPGFGQGNYGKNCQENCYLLKHLNEFNEFNLPILVGWSRKSMIGDILNKPAAERLIGSIAAAIIALNNGANILRVHDVAQTVEAVKIWQAVMGVN
jgi:dihydropteroate synthase